MKQFDLSELALNGLRRGFTTGSCATAAVKAAVIYYYHNIALSTVDITLPDYVHFLTIGIDKVLKLSEDNTIEAQVVKYAGDDPDQTDGASISAIIKPNNSGFNKFFAGSGVGTVTAPGINLPIGEPAINPIPRLMINNAINEVLEGAINPGFDLTIGCVNGETIARKTFNLKLGIVGGISILGTTGIVEPMSLEAYKASIEVYLKVALASAIDSCSNNTVAILPGNIGINYAKNILKLNPKQIVHISNFIGFSLDSIERNLNNTTLENLYLLGHPGKIAKILNNNFDTHSAKSPMAMSNLSQMASSVFSDLNISQQIKACPTVEAVCTLLKDYPKASLFWQYIENQIVKKLQIKRVNNFKVKLFDLKGNILGDQNE